MSGLLKLVFRYNVIPIKFPANIFFENQQLILKFIWKVKRPRIPTTNYQTAEKSDMTYYNALIFKMVLDWCTDKQKDQYRKGFTIMLLQRVKGCYFATLAIARVKLTCHCSGNRMIFPKTMRNQLDIPIYLSRPILYTIHKIMT